MTAVDLAARAENMSLEGMHVRDVDIGMTVRLYEHIAPYFDYSTANKRVRRISQISWRTVLGIYKNNRGRFAHLHNGQ